MKKRQSRRRAVKLRLGIIMVLLIVIIAMIFFLFKHFAPGKTKADLNDYFNIKDQNDVGLIWQGTKSENPAKYYDGRVYIEYEFLKNNIDPIYYYDYNEKQLIYTIPGNLVMAEADSNEYYVSRTQTVLDYVIVKLCDQKAYIALDFVKQYTKLEYEYNENPRRVYVNSRWGNVLVADASKTEQVRCLAGIKSDILTEITKGDTVWILEEEDNWRKVKTSDGFIGYVPAGSLGTPYEITISKDFEEPVYPRISKNQTINMSWYQVTNSSANEYLPSYLENVKGLNVLAPTWFNLKDDEGNITSFADTDSVDYAHKLGLEVWATVNDIDGEGDINEILNFTSKRQRLVNQVVSSAIQNSIDGINVDLESISTDSADGYIQFIRELSVKCHNNDIVLSVDNYPPTIYSQHYNRSQQAVFADYIIVMGYEETNVTSPNAGSVASIGYVADAIAKTLKEVPGDRLILGVPFYCRIWQETGSGSKMELSNEAVSMNEAKERCRTYGANPVWDEKLGQYYAEYEYQGSTFKIWLEENASLEKKLQLMRDNKLAGLASWKLGLEADSVWELIMQYME